MQPPRAPGASSAQIAIDQRSVHALVRLPVEEMDLLLRLDRDLNGQVSADELEAARDTVRAYVAKHLRVAADGRPLALSVGRIGLSSAPNGAPAIEAAADAHTASRMATIAIDADFLTEVSGAHKMSGEIRIRDRTDTFVFQRGAVYERRVGADRWMSVMLVVGALLVIAALWMARRGRGAAVGVAAILLIGTLAAADVIMSAPALNATLKTMERLTRQVESDDLRHRADALFRLGVEADGLASLMNLEVESHGMQERELLDLALDRTKALGVAITYNRDKKKFFYDGAAFTAYLTTLPRGAHAAIASFKLLSYEFYQLTPTDLPALTAAADATKRFLARHPTFAENADVHLYLAVDYRDLYRRYLDAHDAANAAKYRQLAREECLRLVRQYPKTEQAEAARQLLQGLK